MGSAHTSSEVRSDAGADRELGCKRLLRPLVGGRGKEVPGFGEGVVDCDVETIGCPCAKPLVSLLHDMEALVHSYAVQPLSACR